MFGAEQLFLSLALIMPNAKCSLSRHGHHDGYVDFVGLVRPFGLGRVQSVQKQGSLKLCLIGCINVHIDAHHGH